MHDLGVMLTGPGAPEEARRTRIAPLRDELEALTNQLDELAL
jgi:hypothetical protein